MEYRNCNFGKKRNKGEGEIRFDDQEILKSENFRYFWSINYKDGEI